MSRVQQLLTVNEPGSNGPQTPSAPDYAQFHEPGKTWPGPFDTRIRIVIAVILRELEKPQSMRRFAAQFRLSPSRFEHLFKKETGQSFKAFLRATRLARAKALLQNPTVLIKEAAFEVGYRDASDFAHDFRKQYGQSPSQSRRPPEPSVKRRGPDFRTRLTVVVPIAGFTNR
jgi:AraC-like DNA-binding protein